MAEERNKSDNGTRYSVKNPLKIILLFEGTKNEPQENPSAISELKYKYNLQNGVRVKDNDRLINDISQGQVVNLVTGSGTTGNRLIKKLRSGIGCDSWEKVFEQYKWLSTFINDHSLDAHSVQIFIFGFSRGAYQALMFTDVLNKVGLSSKWGESDLCKKYVSPASSIPDEEQFSIEYLGLIDTVSATIDLKLHTDRWRILRRLPSFVHRLLEKIYKWLYSFFCKWSRVNLYSIPGNVKRWRHALALNEYRSRFQPKILNGTPDQEQWFLGAHADVGKGYNGGPTKDRDKSLRTKACQTYTKMYGNIVMTWILEPIFGMLKFQPNSDLRSWTTRPIPTHDYINLMSTFSWLIHDSYNEPSNIAGITQYREKRKLSHYHHSALGTYYLLQMSTFPYIPVTVYTLKHGPKSNNGQSTALNDCLKRLIDPASKGDVWMPEFGYGDNQSRQTITQWIRQIIPPYVSDFPYVYICLYLNNVLSNQYVDEVGAFHDYLSRVLIKHS